MPDLLLTIAVVWMTVLLGVTVMAVLRARTTAIRILALDTVTLALVAVLILLAYDDHRSYALDAALMLAALSFISTLAAARFLASGRVFPGRKEER